jgi:predicted Rossmann fold flavoprotein
MKIAVVGAGASGLALAAALSQKGHEVILLEKENRVGKKILVTGNGRCNLSNSAIEASKYNHPEFVSPILQRFDCKKIRAVFKDLGLFTYEDVEGRIFPITNAASSVLDVLRNEIARLGVEVLTDFEAVQIVERSDSKTHSNVGESAFKIHSNAGDSVAADKVILSIGNSIKLAEKLGLSTVSPSFVLGPIGIEGSALKALSGLRIRCAVQVLRQLAGKQNLITTETGELLFKESAVSGILSFNISRFVKAGDTLKIDLLPALSEKELLDELNKRRTERECSIGDKALFDGLLLPRIADFAKKSANISEKSSVEDLVKSIKAVSLKVKTLPNRKNAQVMRGGIALDEINPETFELKKHPGIHAVGEVLDIDAASGGFNLHWAWASALKCAAALC